MRLRSMHHECVHAENIVPAGMKKCTVHAETLFRLKYYERKILFRLKKETEQTSFLVSRTGPMTTPLQQKDCVTPPVRTTNGLLSCCSLGKSIFENLLEVYK